MKTKKLDKKALYNVVYGDGYVSAEMFIDSCVDTIFKSDVSTCSYVIRRDGSEFEVDVRNYRKRDWSLLFYDRSALSVLQSLYDFLYV